ERLHPPAPLAVALRDQHCRLATHDPYSNRAGETLCNRGATGPDRPARVLSTLCVRALSPQRVSSTARRPGALSAEGEGLLTRRVYKSSRQRRPNMWTVDYRGRFGSRRGMTAMATRPTPGGHCASQHRPTDALTRTGRIARGSPS